MEDISEVGWITKHPLQGFNLVWFVLPLVLNTKCNGSPATKVSDLFAVVRKNTERYVDAALSFPHW